LSDFGKRGTNTARTSKIEVKAANEDVAVGNLPSYGAGLAALWLISTLALSYFRGTLDVSALLYSLPIVIGFVPLMYWALNCIAQQYKDQRSDHATLARHPHIYILGGVAGLLVFAYKSGASLQDIYNQGWERALGLNIAADMAAGEESLVFQAADEIAGCLGVALVVAKGLEWWKAREKQ
jgi:hypothetical protein